MIRRESDVVKSITPIKQRHIPRLKVADINEVFEIGSMVGKGRFGAVVYATEKSTGRDVAMKVVSKRYPRTSLPELASQRVEAAEREILILKMVVHPHIILLEKVYDTDQTIYMVLEFCERQLGNVVREHKLLSELDARIVMAGLASAVSYLHKKDIVHRDLKLENILLTDNPENPSDILYVKVIDFGLSAVKGGAGFENMLHTFCGTVVYMAPEMIAERLYSEQCDVWAMGVILYRILSGRFPFESSNHEILNDMILANEPSFAEDAWKREVSPEAINLVKRMLDKNPAFRTTAVEVVNHPWILNKKLDEMETRNILEMMKLWKDDISAKVGEPNWTQIGTTKSITKIPRRSLSRILEVDDKTGESNPDTRPSITEIPRKINKSKVAGRIFVDTRKLDTEDKRTNIQNVDLLAQIRRTGKSRRPSGIENDQEDVSRRGSSQNKEKTKKTSFPKNISRNEKSIHATRKESDGFLDIDKQRSSENEKIEGIQRPRNNSIPLEYSLVSDLKLENEIEKKESEEYVKDSAKRVSTKSETEEYDKMKQRILIFGENKNRRFSEKNNQEFGVIIQDKGNEDFQEAATSRFLPDLPVVHKAITESESKNRAQSDQFGPDAKLTKENKEVPAPMKKNTIKKTSKGGPKIGRGKSPYH